MSFKKDRIQKLLFYLLLFFLLLMFDHIFAADLINNGDGTILDSSTGLVWQQGEGGLKTWENGLIYCENLALANKSDWRLPNSKELLSIVDFSKFNPCIDIAFFTNANSYLYWTSTTVTSSTTNAWYVDFDNAGMSYIYNKTDTYYIRCVRGGE